MRNKKERFKLHNHLLIQLLVSFCAILIFFAICISTIYTSLYEDNVSMMYKKQLKRQAKRIASEMTGYVSADDTEGCFDYQEYLESMEDSNHTDIWLIDNDADTITLKKEFTNADITDIELSDNVETVIAKAKLGKVSYASGYDAIYEKIMMCAAAPVRDEKDRVVGIVLLNSFVDQRDTLMSNSRRYIVYSCAAGIAIAIVLSFLLATIITRPLWRIRQVVRDLTAGDYQKRTNLKGKNEIGILARGMDELAERLEQNEAERQEAEQMRLDFFANVSHELRTPITVMRGYSESLADNVVKEEKKPQYYRRMVQECQSMERLVGDLLTLSKMQNPHFVVEKEPVNLVQIFQDVMRSYKTVCEKKEIEFAFQCDQDVIMMFGDYDRLRQLFLNIVDNAVKFSDAGSTIWIALRQEEEITVSIRDEGVGISPEELPNIFDKFYKSKLRQNAKGSGLGLVIAKYIVEKHEGRVQVESQQGEGTTFIFSFQKYTGELEG